MSEMTVTCDECGQSGEKALPAVDLFGSTVVFTDEDDPESQYVIHGGETICYDCENERYDIDPDEL